MHFIVFTVPLLIVWAWGMGGAEGRLTSCLKSTSPDICYNGDRYDVAKFPSPPTVVDTVIRVEEISEINEEKQTVTIFLEVHLIWVDRRISFNQTDGNITA